MVNNAVFEKAIENMRKQRHIKLVTTEKRLFGIIIKVSYYRAFHRKLVGYRNEKTQIFINKPVYSQLLILKLIKTVISGFWYDYVKPKYGEKAKLCYMDTDSLIVYIKKMVFIKTFQTMLKQGLILPVLSLTDHYQKEITRKLSM